MANGKIFNMILNTINEVQSKNKANPNEATADQSVFDLLRNKLQNLDQKSIENRKAKGKSPVSILDRIKREINSVKRENKKDPNIQTAPGSIFDNIMKKVEAGPQRQASTGIKKIVQDYNLNVSQIPRDIIQQVQGKYQQDRKAFDKQYAQALHDLSKKY